MAENGCKFDYQYQPLIDGKINGVQIKSISVSECKCLKGEKCDGLHKIKINDIKDNRMINYWNRDREFSIDELEKLNYVDKLRITVDEDWTDNLMNGCELAKRYWTKIVIHSFSFGAFDL